MYLVLHDDQGRGALIAAALGGEPEARLFEALPELLKAAAEVRPKAVLASTTAADPLWASGDSLVSAKALRGVPILLDGGERGPVFRAFEAHWREGRPFHHLADASLAEAALALTSLGPEPVPERRRNWWAPLVAIVLGSLILVDLFRPEIFPAARQVIRVSWPVLVLWAVGRPVVAGLRLRIWPSNGAVALLAAGIVGASSLVVDYVGRRPPCSGSTVTPPGSAPAGGSRPAPR